MFCPNCRTQLADNAAFCSNCGAQMRLAGSSVPPAVSAQTPPAMSPAATPSGTSQTVAKKKLPIVPIVAVVALIGLAVTLFLTRGFGLFGGVGVEVKASVNDYSWEELSAISAEISQAGSESDAIEVAKKYHLCTKDGTLDGTQTKIVPLPDGHETKVQIIGFNHDDKADGSGKAGITFLFVDVIDDHSMNSSETNDGGWEDSEMRSYLSSAMENLLPEELLDVVVPVEKMTNNKGQTQQVNAVSVTADTFWLPSYVELVGVVNKERYIQNESMQELAVLTANDEYLKDMYESNGWSIDVESWWEGEGSRVGENVLYDILNAEGSQYTLYQSYDIDFFDSNKELEKSRNFNRNPISWWLRSPYPFYSGGFRYVEPNGEVFDDYDASTSRGVVPGFCI